MVLRDSQIGKEVWENTANTTRNRVSQIGKEVWEQTNNTSMLRVSQIGKEVWITTGSAPPSSGVFFFQPVMPPH
jgi:hypothetical protein